ncbi:MAG: UDP-N-acetylglucosamine 2-epimerase [Salibacteraceae bacterium]
MRLHVLTSSRADYGIYTPVLKALLEDEFIHVVLVAFGSHFSPNHGESIRAIRAGWNGELIELNTHIPGDQPREISMNISATISSFTEYWQTIGSREDNIVLCLGDRHEMMAAIVSSIPYQLKVAHLYGGESTQGSLDDIHRDIISRIACLHFTSHKKAAENIQRIKPKDTVINIGSISLIGLTESAHISREQLASEFGLKLQKPWILFTMHPDISDSNTIKRDLAEVEKALRNLEEFEIIAGLPNDDANNSRIIEMLTALADLDHIYLTKNLGRIRYFSFLKASQLCLGNSSSGILEAAAFNLRSVNIGNRQLGRMRNNNVIDVGMNSGQIIEATRQATHEGTYTGNDIYAPIQNCENVLIEAIKKEYNRK